MRKLKHKNIKLLSWISLEAMGEHMNLNISVAEPILLNIWYIMVQFSSVAQSCPTLCNPMDCGTPGFPFQHQLLELLKLMSIESVLPSKHLILCRPLLSLLIFPSITVFSNESVLRIRWPKYWSFSFSISTSNEYSRLISSKMVMGPLTLGE